MSDWIVWQNIISPHMAGLTRALARRGARVTYVASRRVSADRARLGWSPPPMPGVRLEMVTSGNRLAEVMAGVSSNAVHITQGIVRNGYVRDAVAMLSRQRARWGVAMETVDDRDGRGWIKRLEYKWEFGRKRPNFVLAIGLNTPRWVSARGVRPERVFPFSYFLENGETPSAPRSLERRFRFGFVGQLVSRKRVDLLLDALSQMQDCEFELVVVGDGPLKSMLMNMAAAQFAPNQVCWIGRQPMAEARKQIGMLDCLVLPSDHDGWGAVVSESLLAGVPAICSDACGAAAAVHASGAGGVFPAGDVEALRVLLQRAMSYGPIDTERRRRLAGWAQCLSSDAGARYLEEIVDGLYSGGARPLAPWEMAS